MIGRRKRKKSGEEIFIEQLREEQRVEERNTAKKRKPSAAYPEVKAVPEAEMTGPGSVSAWRFVQRHRIPIGIALLILGLSGIAWQIYMPDEKPDVNADMLVPSVRTVLIAREGLEHEVKSPGTITFLEKAAVTSKILARVSTLLVDQGDFVEAGDPLAQMETFELELQHKQAQASLNSARAQLQLANARYRAARMNIDRQIQDLERSQSDIIQAKASYMNARQNLRNQHEIYRMGGLSREDLKSVYTDYLSAVGRYFQARKSYQMSIVGYRDQDLRTASYNIPPDPIAKREAFIDFNTEVDREQVAVAQAALKNAMLELDSIELLLREATIVSPLAGVVASRAIEVGEEVKQGEPLFTVIRMGRLLISTSVPEEEVQHIQVGQVVRFTVDARGGEAREGVVYQVSPIIDVNTRTAEVKVEVENEDFILSPGMFVRCSIVTRRKENAIAVPDAALIDRTEEGEEEIAYVFVVEGDLVFKRRVVLGGKFADRTEITAGLDEGEQVVADNVQNLKDGIKVEIRSTDRTNEAPQTESVPAPGGEE